MDIIMDLTDKTKEELIKEVLELQHLLNSLREKYDNDISNLKLLEQTEGKNEKLFRKAYLTSRDSININRLTDGMYVSINEGFTKITGYTEEDVIGKTSLEINIWYNLEDRKAMVNELIASGEVKNQEAKFFSKNGSVIIGLITASLIDLDGIPHVLTIIRDITMRKRAEEALAKEQFLINALMNNLTDHVYFKDLESKFIRNNRAHALSFGLDDPELVVGKSDFDFFEENAARQAFEDEQAIIKTG
jgi:PAS domain S-box-containing protein